LKQRIEKLKDMMRENGREREGNAFVRLCIRARREKN